MSKKLVIYIVLMLVLGCTFCHAQADWHKPGATELANAPQIGNIRADVEFLCDTLRQGRARGAAGHSDAAFYIAAQLEQSGCMWVSGMTGRSFEVKDSDVPGHNIIGLMNLPGGNSGTYVVVGAHYDGLGSINGTVYPGADANASGVAAMLEIARSLHRQAKSGVEYGRYGAPSAVIFVAFDAYNDGRAGSQAFWNMLQNGGLHDPLTGRRISADDIKMMLDLDQMGSTLAPFSPDKPNYLMVIGQEGLKGAAQITALNRCNLFYGLDLDILDSYYGSERFTQMFYTLGDRRFFIEAGIPTLYFTSGITDLTNKVSDTADSLDYDILCRRTTLIFRFLEKTL